MGGSDQLQIAFDRLSICQLAQALGIGLREGAGQRNPFRDDKRAGSFSVQRSFFKDHADDQYSGGHIKFVQLARPAWSKRECIEFIIRASGQDPERQPVGRVKAAKSATRQRQYDAARKEAQSIPSLGTAEPDEWTAPVRERWEDGLGHISKLAGKLAGSRGWKTGDLEGLARAGKTALPLLPWSDGAGNKRGWGWLVEKPVFSGGGVALVPVGYHIRYKVYPKGSPPEKRWVFCPYIPDAKRVDGTPKRLSEFQRHLLSKRTKLPAYPFVLGNLREPRLVVVLEGQFDAVSFALAFQWLESGFPPGVCVFGLRGVQSQRPFLSAYGAWLKRHRPFVWIIGDNDEAGRKLDDFRASNDIRREPTFVERISAQGCTVYGELVNHPGCKDFNDVYREATPDLATMYEWAALVRAPLTENPAQ